MGMLSKIFGRRGKPSAAKQLKATLQQNDKLRRQLFSVMASYDAAQSTDANTRYWTAADNLSADASNNAGTRETLRKRARYEIANNSSLAGIAKTLANDLIGTQIRLQLTGMSDEVGRIVERQFQEWAKAVRLADKLRMLRRAKLVDGEAFALLAHNPGIRSAVQLDLVPIECDRVTDPWNSEVDPQNVDGVKLDDYGNPVAYYVLRSHPGSQEWNAVTTEYDTYDAEHVIHWFASERPGQHRGVPEITPALESFASRRGYQQAVVDAAKLAAQFSLIYKTLQTPDETAQSVDASTLIDVVRNMIQFAPEGWEPVQLKAEQPVAAFEGFDRRLLGENARCLNMPLNVAAADSSGYNYASGRLDHQVYWRSQDVDRTDLELTVLDRIVQRWAAEAILIDGYLPQEVRYLDTDWSHQWYYDGREHVDPEKEAKAQTVRLTNKTTTYAAEAARSGYADWQTMMRQQAAEQTYAAELGISTLYGEQASGTQEPAPQGEPTEQA